MVDTGIIPKSSSPYSISDVLASSGTIELLHHSYTDSYNTPGKEGRENLLLFLQTWGWKDLLGKEGIKLVFRDSTCSSPCYLWKALPWPTFCVVLGKLSQTKPRKAYAESFHYCSRVLSFIVIQKSAGKIKKKTGRSSCFPWYTLCAYHSHLLPEMG